MNDLLKLFTDYNLGTIIVFIAIIFSSMTGLYHIAAKITEILEMYRIKKNSTENKEKEIQTSFEKVNELMEAYDKRLKKDEEEIENLKRKMNTIDENLNKFNKATSKNAVYKLANELIAKQWMSQSDYESLQELSDVYMKSGDSHYIIPNIIQRALSLPVLTDEEIEAKMSKRKNDFKFT